MPKPPLTKEHAAATVRRWQKKPTGSNTARLGTAMLAGQWTSAKDAVGLGASGSIAGQARMVLVAAGYELETQPTGPYGVKGYRVAGRDGRGLKARRTAAVATEAAGTTHPALGAHLTVRALALDADGQLVVHLSNGNGSAWTAHLTGHVA